MALLKRREILEGLAGRFQLSQLRYVRLSFFFVVILLFLVPASFGNLEFDPPRGIYTSSVSVTLSDTSSGLSFQSSRDLSDASSQCIQYNVNSHSSPISAFKLYDPTKPIIISKNSWIQAVLVRLKFNEI